jgi:hypothetical protein
MGQKLVYTWIHTLRSHYSNFQATLKFPGYPFLVLPSCSSYFPSIQPSPLLQSPLEPFNIFTLFHLTSSTITPLFHPSFGILFRLEESVIPLPFRHTMFLNPRSIYSHPKTSLSSKISTRTLITMVVIIIGSGYALMYHAMIILSVPLSHVLISLLH